MNQPEPYTIDDIAKICYLAVNMAVEKAFNVKVFGGAFDIRLQIPPENFAQIVAAHVAEAQKIYNTTDAKNKVHFQLQLDGMPQSWKVNTSAPLLPPKADTGHDMGESGSFDFAPKFG